ncbi:MULTISPECIES: fimbrial biogenesis chaperone [unclassified Thermosynechococcus]|uniref:fimbrial biogenesis chaperone n=1 Tax=unclassified Thermosynechococcus TaxID=2622553 RepID=UPI0019FA03D4|nr:MULTISPECIES: fimbria/pilus periplasmic chaperone [unclassified Thermosynechococcus]HIK35974.1 molecular chaperone [Thermosynechococcus sp. M98_K2018_005]HIK47337.1 molecular chaperone [Thermosynechococcus sp. M55_K2018_012]
MRFPCGWRRALLAAVIALGITSRVGAQSSEFYLNAVQVFLSPRQRTVLLTLTNTGQVPINFEISVRRWQQTADGQEELTESDGNVVAFPVLLSVPPGEQRSLRVGVRQPATTQEQAYRLLVTELPPANVPGTKGAAIRLIKTLSLPVFVQPANIQRQGEIVNSRVEGGKFSFVLRNRGNVHIQTLGFTVQGLNEQGRIVFERTLDSVYVLADRDRPFRNIPLPQTNCAQVRQLKVQSVGTNPSLTTEISTPKGICA